MGHKTKDDLVFRLQKRAEIRRQIKTRKSVQNNEPDRISDLLEEAVRKIRELKSGNKELVETLAQMVAIENSSIFRIGPTLLGRAEKLVQKWEVLK